MRVKIFPLVLLAIGFSSYSHSGYATNDASWVERDYHASNVYSFSAIHKKNKNALSFSCSVIKLKQGKFVMSSSLKLKIPDVIKDGKLKYQEKYKASFSFSNGKSSSHEVYLGDEGIYDIFNVFAGKKTDKVIRRLRTSNKVAIKIEDDAANRVIYRFSLLGSSESISRVEKKCINLVSAFGE